MCRVAQPRGAENDGEGQSAAGRKKAANSCKIDSLKKGQKTGSV